MKVSVVIPSFNHARFIGEAVRSVLDQTETDWELIVVDDGSTDASLEVLGGLGDPRIQIVAQENRGAHSAINAGLERAAGEYLAILNSDDAYHPTRLARSVAALDAEPGALLAGSYIEIVDADGQRLGVKHGYRDCEPWALAHPERSFRAGADLRAALLAENFWSTTSNFVMRRAALERVGAFRPLRYTHDWDFALRLALCGPSILLPEPLLRYRVHAHNTIRDNEAAMVFEICWCLAVHLPAHMADRAWFDTVPAETRVDQLLHSLHTFGCERVLTVMLAHRLSEHLDEALTLLTPGDPRRARYLEVIERQLPAAAGRESPVPPGPGWLARLLGRQ